MRDPHVKQLRYSMRHGDSTSFVEPPPVRVQKESFTAVLDDGILTVTMLDHFSKIEDARAVVDPYLRAWELQDELKGSRTGLEFVYEDGEVIDRNPPAPGEPRVISLEAASYAIAGAAATLHVAKRSYPPPPDAFAIDPDVATMWLRYRSHKEGKEPLPGMAYFCLTVVELSAGGRNKAAAKYSIHRDVLAKIGDLSSTRGDMEMARKADGVGVPLSEHEARWLDAAVRLVIGRAAEVAGGKQVTAISMADLPKI